MKIIINQQRKQLKEQTLPVIQQIFNSNFSPVTQNPTIHNPIPTFTNNILFTQPTSSSLQLSQSIPPTPPKMRHFRPHTSTPKRRRLTTTSSPSTLPTRKHHSMLHLPDPNLDLRHLNRMVIVILHGQVHDFLNLFRDWRGSVCLC